MIRAALYVRVSSTEQAMHGYSIQEQTDRLKNYCSAMGWTVYKVYTDPGYSGGSMERPALQELIPSVGTSLGSGMAPGPLLSLFFVLPSLFFPVFFFSFWLHGMQTSWTRD